VVLRENVEECRQPALNLLSASPFALPEDIEALLTGTGVVCTGEMRQMPEAASIDIAAGTRRVRIILHGRLWPCSPDPWDQDALGTTIALHDGTREVQCATVLWSHELVALRGYLAARLSLSGRGPHREWATLDGTVVLHLAAPGPQECRLTMAVQAAEAGRSVELKIGATRAAAELWLAQIDSVLDRYPSQLSHLHLATLPVQRDGAVAGHGAAEIMHGRPRRAKGQALPHVAD
jgi:hypothetical protein